jgi:hypothetical protein
LAILSPVPVPVYSQWKIIRSALLLIQGQKSGGVASSPHFSNQLELITEVDLAAVPQHLLTSNLWMVLKTPILDTEDELVQVH